MARGYEYFEHTADVGIHAWGATLEEAFAEAARGLVAHMVETADAREVGEARVEVDGETPERLLHSFLDEVLYATQTRMWILARADVRLAPGRLVATLHGEAYDPTRHGHLHEIKAVTYHGLAVQASPPDVRVIVDI